jgi:hypothetical protein
MANAYEAGAAGLPFAVRSGVTRARSWPASIPNIKLRHLPVYRRGTGSRPGDCRPDVTFIHAQKADRKGNVLIEGIVGVQKEAVLAAQALRRHRRGSRRRSGRPPQCLRAARLGRDRHLPSCPAAPIHPTPTATIRATTPATSPGTTLPLTAIRSLPGWKEHVLEATPRGVRRRAPNIWGARHERHGLHPRRDDDHRGVPRAQETPMSALSASARRRLPATSPGSPTRRMSP